MNQLIQGIADEQFNNEYFERKHNGFAYTIPVFREI